MEEGETISSIIDMAKKEEADLIVMGTTGASGLKEIFIGSVAAEIMENAPCPVFAVPRDAKFDGRLDRIGFTTEFKKEEKLALEFLHKWAKPFEADIYCVHADLKHIEPLAHRMDELKAEFLEWRDVHFDVVDSTDLESAVTAYMAEYRIDVLAMVIHKRNFFQEIFSYSQTKKMAYHLKTPILALQATLFSEGRPKFKIPVIGTA
jgi:nucleotide-binding universal stress UspA family protein